ncbi:rhodanese-like domain-containing protein [Acetonema longum]|uniref:Rhodanese-related sulfurtransferase n=1 Tax=Acetonema longum DSM 6540 TaxID=1009370 RepID=F7NGR9_9FIRM|nr:rhodanese-like domain-containing protein [Acetonema longum]EGO64650.1 Rhodanese-related sulfurtransferase [Acetonema longum DSM 6540]
MGKTLIFTFILLAAVLLFVALAGCGRTGANREDVNVSIHTALELWQNKEAAIIDIRTPEEYRDGHIPEVPLIPLDQLESRLREIPKDKKVLLICRSGNRSSQGTKLLRAKGFSNVYNITGGMNSWRGPVVK